MASVTMCVRCVKPVCFCDDHSAPQPRNDQNQSACIDASAGDLWSSVRHHDLRQREHERHFPMLGVHRYNEHVYAILLFADVLSGDYD